VGRCRSTIFSDGTGIEVPKSLSFGGFSDGFQLRSGFEAMEWRRARISQYRYCF